MILVPLVQRNPAPVKSVAVVPDHENTNANITPAVNAGPQDVEHFEWRSGEGGPILAGGFKLQGYEGRVDKLVEAGK